MDRSTGEGQERQSSAEEQGAALGPGLTAAMADPEVAREMAAYDATLPRPSGPTAAGRCDCSCHRCCVPYDEACEECEEDHPGVPL